MYSIEFESNHRTCIVIGDRNSILGVANLCENAKKEFRVADVRGFGVSQKEMGCGGFTYWLSKPV